MTERSQFDKRMHELHDRLGSMIDQIGHPDYSLRELVDGLREVRDAMLTPSAVKARSFPICEDHTNADWNQPALDDDACVLCRLFYLEAQESLLEEWQQRAQRAEATIAEIQRPLDAQMARLNATVVRQNEEIESLRSATANINDAERLRGARQSLEQIAETPRNRGARRNALATIAFLDNCMSDQTRYERIKPHCDCGRTTRYCDGGEGCPRREIPATDSTKQEEHR